jgi:hypothetical protein
MKDFWQGYFIGVTGIIAGILFWFIIAKFFL